jgi:hypothetical protein
MTPLSCPVPEGGNPDTSAGRCSPTPGSYLQEKMCSTLTPPHLLSLHHRFAYDLIDRRLDETGSDLLRKLQERLAKLAGGVAVMSVGAATESEMKEKKARVEDALHATRAAVEEGVVAGGGVAYLRTQKALDSIKLEGDEAVGAEIVCRALEFPTGRLANYAGQEGALIVQEVKKRSGNEGFNVAAGKYEDLLKADVVDPTKVVRTALQNAASIAALMLTTEALVAAAWVVWITRPQPFQAEVETRSLSRTGGFPLCETSLLCRRASDSMCRLRFFRRWAFGPFDERRKQINWDRQNGRGLMLARNFLHCL